jgi:GTP-binding protein HflX
MKEVKTRDNPRALLVSVRTPDVSDQEADESLNELERLVSTLGFRVMAKEWQRRSSTRATMIVGEGKLKSLARYTGGPGTLPTPNFAKKTRLDDEQDADDADDTGPDAQFDDQADDLAAADPDPVVEKAEVVVFDCDLSPSQLKKVEAALGVEVLDRTGVIIEIFSRHAKSRAARLQVEIARLNYLAPRLRETGDASERQAGRGSGESQLELDRRRIRDRVTELKSELESVQREQGQRRSQRSDHPTVALVGYTNAGKSSTMRALTGSQVLVQDKLFATLDTTVRALQPETQPRILVTDTVGFIKKLPHDLVASFRSTLDEAHNASLLLYVVDAADPTFRAQLEVTYETLDAVGVKDTPSLMILNKSDQLDDSLKRRLSREFPNALMLSTRNPDDIKNLRNRILEFFEKDMIEDEIFVPYTAKGMVGEVRQHMRVLKEDFEDGGVRFKVRTKESELARFKKKFS